MTLTGIKSLPVLRGNIVAPGPWQALFARAGYRVYPYQMGCAVRSNSTGTTVQTHGLGEFAQNDYFIVCRPAYYGDSFIYIPNTSLISRVTSDPSAATDDELTITPARSVLSGDWMLNLGPDTAATPLTTPNYDGSAVALYTDPVGNNASGNPYLLTGQGGNFQGWIEGGYFAVDLLVTDPSAGLVMAMPTFNVGREIV